MTRRRATGARIVVIGAGPAGAGLAQRLAHAGHEVLLAEREPRPGGVAGSIEVAGIRADLGSHRLHRTVAPEILAELRRLLGSDLQERRRRGRIRLGGRWLAFPLRPGDLARHLPPAMAAGIARDTALAPVRRRTGPAPASFAEAVRAGVGPTLAERFYLPYARKIWGRDPEDLSAAQARARVAAGSPLAVIRRVVGRGDRGRAVFLAPRRGYGQLWEALVADAAAEGADVRLGTGAERIDLGPDGPVVHLADGSAHHAALVASTVPLAALVRLVRPEPPESVRQAAAALVSRAMTLVYLELDGRPYTPFDAHYLPEPTTPVTRISEPPNFRDGDDPPDRTLLCAEIPCEVGDAVWSAGEEALAGVVAHALGVSGMPAPRIRSVHVHRLPSAYPVLDRGYEGRLEVLAAWSASLEGVLTLGRQGLHVHDNAHHALAMAWAAADAIGPSGALDRAAWGRSLDGFAHHVVED